MRKTDENIKYIERTILRMKNNGSSMSLIATHLGTTRQTISKWIYEIKLNGKLKKKAGIAHNKYDEKFNQNILNLFDSNKKELVLRFGDSRKAGAWLPTIRYFKSKNNLTCSEEHIRKILIKNNRVTSRTKRKTKRVIRKRLSDELKTCNSIKKSEILKESIELITNKIYHGKTGVDGFRIEVDGCFDHWFGKTKDCLYFAIDSFSGTLLSLNIQKEETNVGYLGLFTDVLNNHGKPSEVRTDRRNGLYKGTMYNALTNIGLKVSSSSDPTFKPNVERAFQNAQNLFPILFMDLGINSPEDLLARKDEVINFYNSYFRYSLSKDNCFIAPCKDEMNSFYLRNERKGINVVSHVHINGKNMAPFSKANKRIYTEENNVVFQDTHGNYFLMKNNKKYELKEIKIRVEDPSITESQKLLDKQTRKNESFRKTYIRKALEFNKIVKKHNAGEYVEPIEISL